MPGSALTSSVWNPLHPSKWLMDPTLGVSSLPRGGGAVRLTSERGGERATPLLACRASGRTMGLIRREHSTTCPPCKAPGAGAAAALVAVDVDKVESHSPVPRMAHQSGRRNRIMVDVGGSSPDGSIIDLTSH